MTESFFPCFCLEVQNRSFGDLERSLRTAGVCDVNRQTREEEHTDELVVTDVDDHARVHGKLFTTTWSNGRKKKKCPCTRGTTGYWLVNILK